MVFKNNLNSMVVDFDASFCGTNLNEITKKVASKTAFYLFLLEVLFEPEKHKEKV